MGGLWRGGRKITRRGFAEGCQEAYRDKFRMKPEHLKNILKGCEVSLTAEEISAVEAAAAPKRIAGGGMRSVKFYNGRPVFSKP